MEQTVYIRIPKTNLKNNVFVFIISGKKMYFNRKFAKHTALEYLFNGAGVYFDPTKTFHNIFPRIVIVGHLEMSLRLYYWMKYLITHFFVILLWKMSV